MGLLEATVEGIVPQDPGWRAVARARLERLTMPFWALGRLMDLAEDLAGMTRAVPPPVARRAVVAMAGDHGVVAEGVSQYPREVTVQMVRNFACGGAGINALAGVGGARLVVADLGVAGDLGDLVRQGKILSRRMGAGTGNIAAGPAMGRGEAVRCIEAGIGIARDLGPSTDVFGTGDMGIGNTTPIRVGTTSYIVPDEILPNVRFLAGRVRDIELILFEVDDGPNNLPAPDVVEELRSLAGAHGLTYTVHLPLDLRLGAEGAAADISLVKAKRVIDCTRPLDPWAYVLHLDGRETLGEAEASGRVRAWQDRSVRALEIVAGWAGDPARLAVENLERYPPGFVLPVLARAPVSRCVDVGHLWLDGHDPVPHLRQALPRTRVVHLHGIDGRDHQSLAHTPPERLHPVIRTLCREGYSGVLTLEVFGEEDFHASIAALERAWAEVTPRIPGS